MEFLVHRGTPVRSLDCLPHEFPPLNGKVDVVQADVCDAEAVARSVRGCEVVFHNAALVPVSRSGHRFQKVNVGGTENVLAACLEQKVRKVVYVSSSSVYGIPKAAPLDEDTPLSPFGEYGRSKAAAEALCQAYKQRGLDISILRPRTILGRGRLGILEILFERLRLGKPLFMLGSGNNRFQLVGVDDIVNACYLAATAPCHNEDFNAGAHDFGTLRQDLEALVAHAGSGCRIIPLPQAPVIPLLKAQEFFNLGPFVGYHYRIITRDVWFSTDKLQRVLGWTAESSNQDVLRDTYDWYLAHRGHLNSIALSPHMRGVKGRLLGKILKVI